MSRRVDTTRRPFNPQQFQEREGGYQQPQKFGFSQTQPQRPQYFPPTQQPQRFFPGGALASQPRLFSQNHQSQSYGDNPMVRYGLPVTIQFSAMGSQQRSPNSQQQPRPEGGDGHDALIRKFSHL